MGEQVSQQHGMLSVRIFFTDYASPLVARLLHELGASSHLEVFGRLTHFYSQVARYYPSGVLDGATAARISMLAGWTGAADVFMEAMLRAGVLCRPSVDPHHHKRCTCKAPGRAGEPARQHPGAELAVHEWDQRMGRPYREFIRGSRPAAVSILLRPPPRGARVGYGSAPQGNPQGVRLDEGDALRVEGASPPALRGDAEEGPRGAPSVASPGAPVALDEAERPAGRSPRVRGSALRGVRTPSSVEGPPAPRGAKRPPKPHGSTGKGLSSTTPPAGAPRRAGPPAEGPGGTSRAGKAPRAGGRRGAATPSSYRPTPEDVALGKFARKHEDDGRLLIPLARIQAAWRFGECPDGRHGDNECLPMETPVCLAKRPGDGAVCRGRAGHPGKHRTQRERGDQEFTTDKDPPPRAGGGGNRGGTP